MTSFVAANAPDAIAHVAVPEAVAERHIDALGSRADIEWELDDALVLIREFCELEPDEVMTRSAALSARMTQLEVHLHRVEKRDKEYSQIRTMQVGKILNELDRQFKIASRLIEIRRQDVEQLRGGR